MVGGPVRTCVACRATRPQIELLRLAREKDGSVSVGTTGGRGAYVCLDAGCIEAAWGSGRLNRALKAREPLPERVRDELLERIGDRRLG